MSNGVILGAGVGTGEPGSGSENSCLKLFFHHFEKERRFMLGIFARNSSLLKSTGSVVRIFIVMQRSRKILNFVFNFSKESRLLEINGSLFSFSDYYFT